MQTLKAKPIGERVLLEMRQVGVTEGGIVLPDSQGYLETEGVVVAVGPEVYEIGVGDSIIIPATGVAFQVLIEKKTYVVIKEQDVLINLGNRSEEF